MNDYKLKLEFAHPKYWPAWLAVLGLFLTSLLPYSTLLFIGKYLGKIAYFAAKRRRNIARRNIELCFPDLSPEAIDKTVQKNFENVGIALFEMGIGWFWPTWRIKSIVKITGGEHLDAAKKANQGVLILGAHFLSMEVSARAGGIAFPTYAVYRKHTNPVLDYWTNWGRMRNNKGMIDRYDIKGMLRTLKKGEILWYTADHDFGYHASSVFVPFFDVKQANTISGVSTLARIKNTCVIPVYIKRLPGTQGYEITYLPKLENFPSKDTIADATVINQQYEAMIKDCDDQYMWMHRRFKTRPEGEDSLYHNI